MTRRPRGERGAVAVIFAVCASLLFGLAAIAVDLGNAYQRKRAVQSQADLTVLAATAELPDRTAALVAVCRSTLLNEKVGQTLGTPDCSDGGPVTHSETTLPDPACPVLSASSLQTHVFFFHNDKYRLKVCSPPARVDFGFARALPGVNDSVQVSATASAAAGTPGARWGLPYYGVTGSGCDWGAQGLTDPANGHVVRTGLPADLAPSTPPADRDINIQTIDPGQLAVGLTSATVKISGRGLSKVTKVGFYREAFHVPNVVEPPDLPASSDSTGRRVDFAVPATVLATQGLWYVRVYEQGSSAATSGWSTKALPLRVGDPLVTCDSVSNAGNFGALKLPRTDSHDSTSNGWMANNTANGPQAPLSLQVHAEAAEPWTCTEGGPGVVLSTVTGSPSLRQFTNCVTTDTGLTATATTAGLITGTTLFPDGRLANRPTSTEVTESSRSCGPGRSSSSRTVLGRTINNDTLTCFLTDPNTPISTIASPTYTGGVAFDQAIFSSPRFCYVPILRKDPSRGRSLSYSIVDMRPCFITGESVTSTWNNQVFRDGTDNGITLNSNGTRVGTLNVIFFNRSALPTVGPNAGDYIGIGPRSVSMTD